MIFFLFFFAFFFSGTMLLGASRLELVCVVCCFVVCCVSLARYLPLKVVCWPCRAGKAYRRLRPPTLTPQVCTLHWNYMYYIILLLFCPFFCLFHH